MYDRLTNDQITRTVPKTIQRWDYEKHIYEDVENEYGVRIYYAEDELDEIIRCVNCGDEMVADDGYTSHQWHNHFGFGYLVCEKCYEIELEKREKSKKIMEDTE